MSTPILSTEIADVPGVDPGVDTAAHHGTSALVEPKNGLRNGLRKSTSILGVSR